MLIYHRRAGGSSHLLDIHHDEAIDLRKLLLVEPAICQRHDCGRCALRSNPRTLVWKCAAELIEFVLQSTVRCVDCETLDTIWQRQTVYVDIRLGRKVCGIFVCGGALT